MEMEEIPSLPPISFIINNLPQSCQQQNIEKPLQKKENFTKNLLYNNNFKNEIQIKKDNFNVFNVKKEEKLSSPLLVSSILNDDHDKNQNNNNQYFNNLNSEITLLSDAAKAYGYIVRSIELLGTESKRLAGARDFSNTLHWTQSMKFLKEKGYIYTKTGHGTTVSEKYVNLGKLLIAFRKDYKLETISILPRLARSHSDLLDTNNKTMNLCYSNEMHYQKEDINFPLSSSFPSQSTYLFKKLNPSLDTNDILKKDLEPSKEGKRSEAPSLIPIDSLLSKSSKDDDDEIIKDFKKKTGIII
jgi:hypothetical protein